jgi:hypothetical protein
LYSTSSLARNVKSIAFPIILNEYHSLHPPQIKNPEKPGKLPDVEAGKNPPKFIEKNQPFNQGRLPVVPGRHYLLCQPGMADISQVENSCSLPVLNSWPDQ